MDHASGVYLSDDTRRNEESKDTMYYPAAKYIDMDGFFILHVNTYESLLPYEIVINSLGLAKDDIPMIGVVVGDMVVFISVSEDPQNLSRKDFPDQERIFKWIVRHFDALIRHWNKELSDRELLDELFREYLEALYEE